MKRISFTTSLASVFEKKRTTRQKKMSRDTKEPTNFLYFFTDMIVFDSS